MPGLRPDVDPDGLLEYSVVFTDRSLNHMSRRFQDVVRTIAATLRRVYGAEAFAAVPGGGTYAMESVARQLADDRRCLIVRNGWFSYRWSQILERGRIANDIDVLQARPVEDRPFAPFAPPPLDEVVDRIRTREPAVVFAPHVETSAGILLPDAYVRAIADAVHAHGGLFVLDAVASGAVWVDMKRSGVDVLITAPQKGWSAPPSAGLVLMGERAVEAVRSTTSSSFACDLGQWLKIVEAYESGGHAYHATMPTDGLARFHDAMLETEAFGFNRARDVQVELGRRVRAVLVEHGYPSVAAEGFEAPSVVVSYTADPDIRNGKKFAKHGVQVAGGVPLQCDEPDWFSTFRIGLFGLDKLSDPDRTVDGLEGVLDRL